MLPLHRWSALLACLMLSLTLNEASEAAAPPDKAALLDRYGDPLPPGAVARLGTLRLRHGRPIVSVAFSPDGKTLASACEDGAARLWDVALGVEVRSLDNCGSLNSIAFSPDGKTLVGEGNPFTQPIFFWDAGSGKRLRTLGEHPPGRGGVVRGPFAVRALALSPNGKALAIAEHIEHVIPIRACSQLASALKIVRVARECRSRNFPLLTLSSARMLVLDGLLADVTWYEFAVRLRDHSTGRELVRIAIEKGGGRFVCVGYAPDGKVLAAGATDGAIRLYDPATGKLLARLQGPTAAPLCIAFSPDGKKVIVGDEEGHVRIWQATSGKQLRLLQGHKLAVRSVVFTLDGKYAVTGSEDRIQLWEVASGKVVRQFRGLDGQFRSLALSPNGKLLAGGGTDGIVRLWDVSTGKSALPLDGHRGPVAVVAFSPRGEALASVGVGWGFFWDLREGKTVHQVGAGTEVLAVAYSQDGRALAVAGSEKGLQLWDRSTGKALYTIGSVKDRACYIAFTADGKALVSRHESGLVRTWERPTGRLLIEFGDKNGNSDGLGLGRCLLSPDGAVFAIEDADRKIKFWRVADGKLLRVLERQAFLGAFSPDGKLFASAADHILLWDVATGKQLGQMKREATSSPPSFASAFSPDGRALASADADGKITLGELATGGVRRTFVGHRAEQGPILTLAFSPDGRRLASAGEDTTILLWDHWAPPRKAGRAEKLTAKELLALWNDLASPDAARAYDAACALAAFPRQAVPLLRRKLSPILPARPGQVARLLAELKSDQFAVRERAEEELEKLDELAVPELRTALTGRPDLEVTTRIERILGRTDGKTLPPVRVAGKEPSNP